MNRRTAAYLLERQIPIGLVAVGRRGRDFLVRYGRDLRAEFSNLGDRPTIADISPIARIAMDGFVGGEFDRVTLAYNKFVSTMVQRPTIEQLLPIRPEEFEYHPAVEYIYEPSAQAVLDEMLPRFVEMQVYQAVLEAIASFQSAQMVAMRNATDNANDLISDLTLAYNKARQEQITKELLDLVGGAEALVKK
jgi:F-type H+-transporting ATPase subunit gamma